MHYHERGLIIIIQEATFATRTATATTSVLVPPYLGAHVTDQVRIAKYLIALGGHVGERHPELVNCTLAFAWLSINIRGQP